MDSIPGLKSVRSSGRDGWYKTTGMVNVRTYLCITLSNMYWIVAYGFWVRKEAYRMGVRFYFRHIEVRPVPLPVLRQARFCSRQLHARFKRQTCHDRYLHVHKNVLARG